MTPPFTRPNQVVDRFEAIDFAQALSQPRRFLCLDLDNTLLPQKGLTISKSIIDCLHDLRQRQLVKDICLISNVILPGHRVRRLYRLAKELEIVHVVPGYFWNRKPQSAPFKQALKLLKATPQECVMVGDQIFSDIVGGNRMGFYTIWVMPMACDHWSTRLTGRRQREQLILNDMKAQGLLNTILTKATNSTKGISSSLQKRAGES